MKAKNFLQVMSAFAFVFFISFSAFAQGESELPQIGYIDQIMAESGNFSVADLSAFPLVGPRWLDHDLHTRERYEISTPWSFFQINNNKVGEAAEINIPHQFSVRDGEAGWYVQNVNIDLPKRGERYFLMLEQVRMLCVVFVNGQEITRHLGGYTPFEADITRALKKGINTIAMYVHNTSVSFDPETGSLVNQVGMNTRPNAEKMMYGSWLNGGIIREIYLEKRSEVFVRETAIVSSVEKEELTVEITLQNFSDKDYHGVAKAEILSWPDGKKLLELEPFDFSVDRGASKSEVKITSWENAPLWSPEHPNLCVLRVTLPGDKSSDLYEERFGFREFVIRGKQFYLNGTPVKLRGPSSFVPGGSNLGREQHFKYIKKVFLCEKEVLDYNAYRTHAAIFPRVVFEAADEAGVMLINQSAIWSSMKRYYEKGGEEFMKNTLVEFEEWIKRDRNSPSVVIWDVENEMLRMGGELSFWKQLDDFVLEHDTSRIITHSGSGDDPVDRLTVNHAHMAESYTNQLKKWKEQSQAPLILGEYWLGSRGEHRLTSSKEVSSFEEYILEYARLFNEKTLEIRYYNASGIMPFAVQNERLYYKNGITDLANPAVTCEEVIDDGKNVEIMRHGIASLTSFFWPRIESADHKGFYRTTVIVCNDLETSKELQLTITKNGTDITPLGFKETFTLRPGERRTCDVSAPAGGKRGVLRAELTAGGKLVSSDELVLRGLVSPPTAPSLKKKVYFIGSREDAQMISSLGISIIADNKLPEADGSIVIFGTDYVENESLNIENIHSYLEEGGMIISLHQERLPDWSPVQLGLWTSSSGAFAIYAPIYAAGHRVFSGITEDDLRWWEPTSGMIAQAAYVRPGAVNKSSRGAWRALAGASRFENMSLVEMKHGRGTLILSQLHLLENLTLSEPRQILFNMLSYLDSGGWKSEGSIKLAGSVNKAFLTDELGVMENSFSSPVAKNGDLLIAGKGAEIQEIMDWAHAGGKVVLFSEELVSKMPGFQITSDNNYRIAVREADHPLLWGISSINFSENDHPIATASFTDWPDSAKILFESLKSDNPTRSSQMTLSVDRVTMFPIVNGGPAIMSMKIGDGEIILMPFDINERSPLCRELVSTIIANAGAEIEIEETGKLEALMKRTNPPVIDGNLDDWTEDMGDRNITQYIHADPIVFSAKNAVGKKPESDMDFSGIVYFMWDHQNLYLAGTVFGNQNNQNLTIQIGNNDIFIDLKGQPALLINGQPKPEIKFGSGRIAGMNEYNDAGLLSFTQINRRMGMLERVNHVPNVTFETAVPWQTVNLSPESNRLDVMIELSSDEYKLVLPTDGNTGSLIVEKNTANAL